MKRPKPLERVRQRVAGLLSKWEDDGNPEAIEFVRDVQLVIYEEQTNDESELEMLRDWLEWRILLCETNASQRLTYRKIKDFLDGDMQVPLSEKKEVTRAHHPQMDIHSDLLDYLD